MQCPSCQHDHLARLPCSQAGPRCCRGPPASRHQHRAAARCSGGMELAVRSAWVESAIAHVPKTPTLLAPPGFSSCAAKARICSEPCPPGTGFLDAETGAPKAPPETTDARRDQKEPEPVAQIPAQTAYLNLTGNYPGSEGLDGGGRSRTRTGLCIENPCFVTRTAKSRRRLADPTVEKRRWQSGFEQPPHCVQAQITGNLRALIREFEDAKQGRPKKAS